MRNLRVGDIIESHACKTDGTVYRSWKATIESISADVLVTISPAGSSVFNIKGEDYPLVHHYRAYYWFDKFYNLLEVFETDGRLFHIYINIASPPEFKNGVMSFKDHELDVSDVYKRQTCWYAEATPNKIAIRNTVNRAEMNKVLFRMIFLLFQITVSKDARKAHQRLLGLSLSGCESYW